MSSFVFASPDVLSSASQDLAGIGSALRSANVTAAGSTTSVVAAALVTSFYDWSGIDEKWREAGIFPVISEATLRATLGILDRTVRHGLWRG